MIRRALLAGLVVFLTACAPTSSTPPAPATIPPITLPEGLQRQLDQGRTRAEWLAEATEACQAEYADRLARVGAELDRLEDAWEDPSAEPPDGFDEALAEERRLIAAMDRCIDDYEGGGPPGLLDPTTSS